MANHLDTSFDGLSFMHPQVHAPGVHAPANMTGNMFLSSVDYINMSNRHIYVINRDNLTVRLPAKDGHAVSTNKVLMRQRFNFADNAVITFIMYELADMQKKGRLIDPVLISVYKQLTDLERMTPNGLRSANIIIDRVVELEQVARDETIYISSLDVVLVVDSIKRGFAHPFSAHGEAFLSYENFVREQVLSGAFIELIDNETRISRRFISMGRQILEIIPKRDPKRESGVYWSTAEHQGRDKVHSVPVYMSIDEAEEALGLCKTREEAEGAGDAAAKFKAEMLRAQNALAQQEHALAQKKQEFAELQHVNSTEILHLKKELADRELKLSVQKQDNEALAARFEAEKLYRNAHTGAMQNHESIAADARKQVLEEIEAERKAKEAKEKAEREDRSSKKKDKLEDKKAKRENTSSLFKYIPAIIAGGIAIVLGVGKIFSWW